MDYGMTPELEEFRAEVSEFVAANKPAITVKAGVRSAEDAEELALLKEWTGKLFAAGYVGADWPEQYGGKGSAHSSEKDVVVGEELARGRAPAAIQGAAHLVSHALIDFGTEEQRQKYLPRIRTGELIFCQLFSEPSSGSDLASLRTKAVPTESGGSRSPVRRCGPRTDTGPTTATCWRAPIRMPRSTEVSAHSSSTCACQVSRCGRCGR